MLDPQKFPTVFKARDGMRRLLLRVPNLDVYLIILLVVVFGLLNYRLNEPEGTLIFDETYYVQDARVIAGLAVTPEGIPDRWFSGGDPNSEHPPLAKLIMAAGISIFQADATGWRFPSVLLGILSLLCIYGLVLRLGGTRVEARLATTILAFDNLFFVHARIATLDIYLAGFCLLGTWLYFRSRYELSALSFALGTLCKINGLFAVLSIALYELVRWKISSDSAQPLPRKTIFIFFSIYLSFTFFALGALDCYFTEFRTPIEHIHHIFQYAATLVRQEGVAPQGIESTPLQWWLNERAFDYFSISYSADGITSIPILFQGKMSNFLIAVAPFSLVYCCIEAKRGSRIALLAVCLFLANYLPVLASWFFARRICYIYYMVPSLPAFSLATAHALRRFPTWAQVTFPLAVVYSFYFLFPFRD